MAIITQLAPWQQTFKTSIVDKYEGNVDHFYLDTVGLVTIAEGCQVALPEAQGLAMVVGTRAATVDEITADYERVQAMQKGLVANAYYATGAPSLPPFACLALVSKRIDDFTDLLQSLFPAFDHWPDTAKIATLEMPWGLGDYKFRTLFPKLRQALEAQNWRAAAMQCAWSDPTGIYKARNAHRQFLYLQAAQGA